MPKKILITGVSGLIGGAIWDWLKPHDSRYELYGLARRFEPSARANIEREIDVPADHRYLVDITNFDSVQEAVQGKDVVVHMAANPEGNAPWESVLQNNIVGTYNVFEACKIAKVKRIVYASTIMVSWSYMEDEPYKAIVEGRYQDVPPNFTIVTKDMPIRPSGFYPSSKVWGEAIARYYSDIHNMSMICLRIGGIRHPDRPTNNPMWNSIWCSQKDMAHMVEKCIEAPTDLKYDIFYVVSNNRWRFVDIEHARTVVGYQPMYSAENII